MNWLEDRDDWPKAASTTKCYRHECTRPAEMLLWSQLPTRQGTSLGLVGQRHACELHAIEDDDAGHVRRAIRLGAA